MACSFKTRRWPANNVWCTCLCLFTVLAIAVSAQSANQALDGTCVEQPRSSDGQQGISKYIDISVGIHSGTVEWESNEGIGSGHKVNRTRRSSGDLANASELRMSVHVGTHVDAPSHFIDEAYQSGEGVEILSLDILNGGVFVVSLPGANRITSTVLDALNLPYQTQRVLFKTDNTKRGLMQQLKFDRDYVAFNADGANWIARQNSIHLVGIDYMSIAKFDELEPAHQILLEKGIVVVEGLDLRFVEDGFYILHCLPVKLIGFDGAPTRCVLEVV